MIVGISVGATILLILFYFLIFRNKKLERQVRELERRYDYLHTLLVGQDNKYIKRLDYISQVNLLYGDIHDKHLKRYQVLHDEKDAYCAKKMKDLKELITSKKYNVAREELNNVKKIISEFEQEIISLNDDLQKIIRPEEECNHIFLEVKEHYRLIRNEYSMHESELGLLKDSYNAVFKYVEDLFKKFDNYVDSANYDDATNIIPQIQKVLKELENINKVIPELVTLADRTLPNRLSELEAEYKKLNEEKVPVQHFIKEETIVSLKNALDTTVKNLKNFTYRNEKEKMNNMIKIIDEYFANFVVERDAKREFEQDVDEIYAKVTNLEKSFIKLCNSIPKIKKFYMLENDKVAQRNDIQKHINKIGVSKRSLDTFIHSSIKQPYSILLKKTTELKLEASQIEKEMEGFRHYLFSLKQDVEDAHDLIFSIYYRVRKYEKIIRDASIPNFANKYKEKLEEIYKHLEIINTTVTILPIDVKKINESVTYLKFTGESTLNQIEQESNTMKMAESAILYLNPKRLSSIETRTILEQSEKMFFDGEFEKAYDETVNIVYRNSHEAEKR